MPVANRIESFDVLVPAGTAKSAPQTTSVAFADGQLVRVELDVPSGHNGLTGIQILAATGQFIPYTEGAFLVANDHLFGWDVIGIIDTGSFQARCYNTDVFDHSFHLRFSVLDFAYALAPTPPPPVSVAPVLV